MVVLPVLAFVPTVERLVDHENSQPVACVEKYRRRRIVASANGVESVRLHQFDAALFRAVNRRRSEQSVVMMHAAAFELEHLAVEPETILGVHFDLPDSKMR